MSQAGGHAFRTSTRAAGSTGPPASAPTPASPTAGKHSGGRSSTVLPMKISHLPHSLTHSSSSTWVQNAQPLSAGSLPSFNGLANVVGTAVRSQVNVVLVAVHPNFTAAKAVTAIRRVAIALVDAFLASDRRASSILLLSACSWAACRTCPGGFSTARWGRSRCSTRIRRLPAAAIAVEKAVLLLQSMLSPLIPVAKEPSSSSQGPMHSVSSSSAKPSSSSSRPSPHG